MAIQNTVTQATPRALESHSFSSAVVDGLGRTLGVGAVLLALLPIPAMNNMDLRYSQRLNDIRADLQYAAQRSQNMEEFKRAIRELRERREREHQFDRNQKKAPADTVVP